MFSGKRSAASKGSHLLRGAGSILNLAGCATNRKRPRGDASTDMKALQSDWIAVGNDIRKAFTLVTANKITGKGSTYASRASRTK
jgi:hypothetical protein